MIHEYTTTQEESGSKKLFPIFQENVPTSTLAHLPAKARCHFIVKWFVWDTTKMVDVVSYAGK